MLDFVKPERPKLARGFFTRSAADMEQACIDHFSVEPYLERFIEIQSMRLDLGRLTIQEFETKVKEAESRAKLYYGIMLIKEHLTWAEVIPIIREAGYGIDSARKYYRDFQATNKEKQEISLSQPKCEFKDNEIAFAFLAGATLSARPLLKEKRVFPRLSINCKNPDRIDHVKNAIQSLTGRPATQNAKIITADNLELFWNIHCAYGENSPIPESIIYNDSEAIAFLQGVFSVRGHYDKSNNRFMIGANWPDAFRADFTRLCERFGIYTSLVSTNLVIISERNSLKNLFLLDIISPSEELEKYAFGERQPNELVPIIIFRRYQNLIQETPALVNHAAELERRLKVSRGVFEDWKKGKYSKVIRSYLKVKSENVSEPIQIRKMIAHLVRADLPRLQGETNKIVNPRYKRQVRARLKMVHNQTTDQVLGKATQKALSEIAKLTAGPLDQEIIANNVQTFAEKTRAITPAQILLKDLKKEPDSDFFYQNEDFCYFDPYACLDGNGQGDWSTSKIKIQDIAVMLWMEDLFRGMAKNDKAARAPDLPDLSAPAEIRKILLQEFSKDKNVVILGIN